MNIVKVSKSGRNRVALFFDDGSNITVAYEIFLKNQLKLKQEISPDVHSFILSEDQKYLAKQYALNFLAKRHHSKSEIRTKLKQKKIAIDLIELVLNELEQKKYLDDYAFAKIFLDEKIKTKRWGKFKIKAELIKRGISASIIEETLKEKFVGGSEIETGLELAHKKFNVLAKREVDPKKIKANIFSFLISRGYDYDSCQNILNRLLADRELSNF